MKSETEFLDLARHAVTLPGWRWIPGMLTMPKSGLCALPIRLGDERHPSYPDEYNWPHDLGLRFPDLSDPATLGCLLALVREVHPGAHAEPNGAPEWDGRDAAERDHWWAVYAPGVGRIATGPTEAAALVAALGVSGG